MPQLGVPRKPARRRQQTLVAGPKAHGGFQPAGGQKMSADIASPGSVEPMLFNQSQHFVVVGDAGAWQSL